MKKFFSQKWEDRLFCMFAALIGAISFVILYGIKILNTGYDDWLFIGGDLTQHYLGWLYYRKGDWTFPFGLTDRLAYPSYTSVIYTDSIPIFAVIFKILSPFLPDKFQYFGIWGIMCFILQAFFAYKTCQEFKIGKLNSLIVCLFFVFSPAAHAKLYKHTALGGHWIVLFAIYLFSGHKKDYKNIVKSSSLWALMALLISSIHMYYLPMCGIFLVGYVFCSLFIDKKVEIKYFCPLISFITVLFINTYLLGGFSSSSDFSADGLGECSFNLNSFFSNKGYSRWLPSLPKRFDLQYEGFAYLGMGMIFLLAFFVITFIIISVSNKKLFNLKNIERDTLAYSISYLVMCLIMVILAASPVVTFGDRILFTFPDIDIIMKCWSVFRSSGRLIWPVMYLIFFGLICWTQNNQLFKSNNMIVTVIFAITVVLQLYDLEPKLGDTYSYFRKDFVYSSSFKGDIWDKLTKCDNIKHVILVSNDYENSELLRFAMWADENDYTINRFYFARGIDVRENTKYSMEHLNDESIYVFKNQEVELMKQYYLNYYSDGEYTIGLFFDLETE